MGKVLGGLSLAFGLIALLAGWAILFFVPLFSNYIVWGLCGAAVVLGIIGIIVDDSKGLAIAGLVIGAIAAVVYIIVWPLVLVGLLASILGGMGAFT